MKHIHILLLASKYILLFTMCSRTPGKLEQALTLAGNNRPELEKVLQHYSAPADSLKLQAARFLIENMPGHYTLRGEKIDYCRQIIDQDSTTSYFHKKLHHIILDHFLPQDANTYREEDIEHITSQYLIRHIDASFKIAEEQKLLELIAFDQFLEHVLPYRFSRESLDLWRDSIKINFSCKSVESLISNFKRLKEKFILKHAQHTTLQIVQDQLQIDPFADCYFSAWNSVLVNRALGFPMFLDYIPHYSNRNGYHCWATELPFFYKPTTLFDSFNKRTAKVYRRSFSPHSTLVPEKGEFIPEFFQDPFIQDVTDHYCFTSDVTITNQTNHHPHHIYLCVFNNLEWKPIAVSQVIHGKAEFKHIAKHNAYLAAYYDSAGILHPFNYPFILDLKGNITYLIPNKQMNSSLRIERKNPDLWETLPIFVENLDNTAIEAFFAKDFLAPDTAFILTQSEKLYYEIPNKYPEKAFSSIRIPAGWDKYIAELYFLDATGKRIQGKTTPANNAIIDGNPLTYTSLQDNPVIIHFASPTKIDKLVCLPRNDGNGIYPENLYELFYFDKNGWQSLGVQEGDRFSLQYNNVPENALYWLRNLTSGVEERIFTHENGEIIFW